MDDRPLDDRGYDVAIVGTGAGGGTLAYQLSRYGHRVLVIERGEFLRPQRRTTSDPVGKYIRHVSKHGDGGSFFVGGDTKFYGSALYRLRESDFSAVEHENGVSPPWPITYFDLEPYYERAEILYRVHGSSAGDTSEPFHAKPYPYPPIGHAEIVADLVDRIERCGIKTSPIPRGIDHGPGGRCILCSTCDGYYCQLDAKMDAEVAALRPALATGTVRLITQTECLKVLTSEDGSRVIGVRLRRSGREQIARAGVVAVCAGATGSVLLLRRSRTSKHPEGLGNAAGFLGRYLAGHSTGILFPLVGFRRVPPTHTKTFAVNAFYDGAPGWQYPTGVIQMAGQIPFWEEVPTLARPLARLIANHSLMCFYMTEALPSRDSGFTFDGDQIARRASPTHNLKTFFKLRQLAVDLFRQAGYFVLARRHPPRVWHEVGTARFGTDPATSVLDKDCQVHGVEGLFVVDASVLPSAGAVNPALTIIALALRAGDHIARRLQ